MWWASVAWAQTLALVGTAGSGGVGSGTDALQVPAALLEKLDLHVDAVNAQHGFLVRGREAVWADDGSVATVQAFLDAPGPCGEPGPLSAVETRDEVVFVPFATAPMAFEGAVSEGSVRAFRSTVRRCEGTRGPVWLAGPDDVDVSDGRPFEHRLALELSGRGDRVWAIGRPDQEMARRVALLESLTATGAHWIDGGSFVDGVSTVDAGERSRHRPLGFDTLRRLQPTALVPGAQELAPGALAFLQEAGELPYVAANWTVSEGSALPTLPPAWRGDLDGVDVAVVGLIDPAVARARPGLAAEGLVLSDPVTAGQKAIDALWADEPPDVTVVLGTFGPTLLARLQTELRHVDVLVGDPSPSVDRLDTVEIALHEPFGGEDEPTITLPVQGVTWAHLDVEDGQVTRARYRPTRITAAIDPDEDTLTRITAVRREAYPAVDRVVLPAPPEGPVATWSSEQWEALLCQAVLERTGAELALLPELPSPPAVPGPLTEKLVLDQLALGDRLEGRFVLGDKLQRLSDKAFEVVPVSCGIELGSSAVVGGRAADPLRAYRLVTTDRLLVDGPTAALVSEALPSRIGDRTSWDPEVKTLVAGIREGLLGLGGTDKEGEPFLARTDAVLARTPAHKTPLWLLRMTRVSLSAARFQGAEDERYAEIPETLATSPSSLTLLADVDAGLEYSDARVAWDLRQRLMFTRLAIETPGAPDDVSEPADDWRSSSSLTVPAWGLTVGSVWSPYTELLLDSELTAVEEEDGTRNPLQEDLSLTLGVSTATGALTLLRLGAFGLRDLSVPDKPWEVGGRAEASTSVSLGAGLAWASTLDAFVFADTPETDGSDLRFKALIDTRLSLPVTRWFSVAPYAQGFAFAGRLPETSDPALAYTVGTSLDLIGALRLHGGP